MDGMHEKVKKMLLASLKGEKRNESKSPFGEKMKAMKVSVIAKDPKDLKTGLSKAQELISKRNEMFGLEEPSEPEMEPSEECPMEMMSDEPESEELEPETESAQMEEESPEEDQSPQDKIKELQKRISELKKQSK